MGMGMEMNIKLLTHTPHPERIVAQAAKLCYWPGGIDGLEVLSDPEPFIEKLVRMEHDSPLEHASFSFGIEGISRACANQLVRHRMASYSQKSQRYVSEDDAQFVVPERIQNDWEARTRFATACKNAVSNYSYLTECLVNAGYSKKEAIEEARYILPNATHTALIVTMNVRALRHFFALRLCKRAQAEIRELASVMLTLCSEVSPALFKNSGPDCAHCREGAYACKKKGD